MSAKIPAAETRRRFLGVVGSAGALALLGDARDVLAQAKPEPEAAVAGTVANAQVLSEKDSVMKPHSDRPLTASVEAHEHDFDVTPTRRMYIRNNLFTPDLDASGHRLMLKGLVDKELSFGVEELKQAFPAVTLQAMLECAGSGRTAFQPTPRGTPWPATGGMGCPSWTGVRLRDLLDAAGVKPNAAHVAGQGGDFGAIATIAPVIRSIPMHKAMDGGTLVAWAINDEPLPKIHGYPLRLVVPGWAGSASTKWLHSLSVLDAPFKGTYMDNSYRIPKFPVAVGASMPPDALITEGFPVKSMITFPAPNARFKGTERITLRGKAWVGEGSIARVQISTDEGVSWRDASLGSRGDKYAWRGFSLNFQPERFGYMTFLARATDDRGNVQPIASYWNPLGYFWNGVHRVGVNIDA